LEKFTFKSDKDKKHIIVADTNGVHIKSYANDGDGWVMTNSVMLPNDAFMALMDFLKKNDSQVTSAIEAKK
jgi:hypothetical protein